MVEEVGKSYGSCLAILTKDFGISHVSAHKTKSKVVPVLLF
jgi:hypothetical protein